MLHERLLNFERSIVPAPLQKIDDAEWAACGVELWLKRDDLLHPVVSGNKWRKLKWVVNDALQQGATCLVSMGGAYSNYLHAMAYLCKEVGIACHAYVRIDRDAPLTPTLRDVQAWGMTWQAVSRGDYRVLRELPPSLPTGACWLPEGGAVREALTGVAELVAEVEPWFDYWACACGTGATLAGLRMAVPGGANVLGVAALKHGQFLLRDVSGWLDQRIDAPWTIDLDSHLGGFAVTTLELTEFMAQFSARHAVPLEPVYTGKLLLALYRKLRAGEFTAGTRVLALHSGGLQGAR